MPVEELSPGVYGWAGQEGVMLRGAGGAGSSAAPQIAELMTEIRDKVHLGLRPAAEDEDALEAAAIEQIVTVGAAPAPLVSGVPVHSIKLGDMDKDPLLGHVLKTLDKIDAALADGGGVLIACEESDETEAGSTAIVIAWLLARRSVPWAEVQAVVSDARPSATLNANFEKQLRVWTGWKEFPGLPEWI